MSTEYSTEYSTAAYTQMSVALGGLTAWDNDQTEDIAHALVTDSRLWHLSCDNNEEAVVALEKMLTSHPFVASGSLSERLVDAGWYVLPKPEVISYRTRLEAAIAFMRDPANAEDAKTIRLQGLREQAWLTAVETAIEAKREGQR